MVTVRSRELLLDVAERLMSERGYAGTPVSAICKEAGVAATSLYWHFNSKEGLLATVMDRGAGRWFETLPRPGTLVGDTNERADALLRSGADAVAANPLFLRLFYMLALEAGEDEIAAELIERVRQRAFEYFREAILAVLTPRHGTDIPEAATDELARFAVAYSDGCFFATQLEPGEADLREMYANLAVALRAMAPTVIMRARADGGASVPIAEEVST